MRLFYLFHDHTVPVLNGGVKEVGAQHRAVGGWTGEGLETTGDIGVSVLGDWKNRLLLGFVSIPYWAHKINYQVEEGADVGTATCQALHTRAHMHFSRPL